MRSVVCLKPGETRACIGCHAPASRAPPSSPSLAVRREASRPVPPPWGERTLSFLRDVQPVLDAKCVSCHATGRSSCRVILSGDLTDQLSIGYEELLPYLSAASAMRWDHPDDVLPQAPYTYGSRVSRLARLLDDGHHGVRLSEEDWLRLASWIDANGVYYDRYETDSYPERRIFTGVRRAELDSIHTRRCAPCHGEGDGRRGTWWLSIDRHDAARSRALRGPLARQAGGPGCCGDEVFRTEDDPDYRRLRDIFTGLGAALRERPREDLASLGGGSAGD